MVAPGEEAREKTWDGSLSLRSAVIFSLTGLQSWYKIEHENEHVFDKHMIQHI